MKKFTISGYSAIQFYGDYPDIYAECDNVIVFNLNHGSVSTFWHFKKYSSNICYYKKYADEWYLTIDGLIDILKSSNRPNYQWLLKKTTDALE